MGRFDKARTSSATRQQGLIGLMWEKNESRLNPGAPTPRILLHTDVIRRMFGYRQDNQNSVPGGKDGSCNAAKPLKCGTLTVNTGTETQ